MGERFVHEQNALPMKFRLKGNTLVEFTRMALAGLRMLYEKNQDFVSLSIDDRTVLLHNTVKYTGCLATNGILHKVGVMNYPNYYDAIAPISSPDAALAARRLEKQLDFDLIIHKLLLANLSLSTIDFISYRKTKKNNSISNIKELLRVQDKYIDLLWRSLLYRYPFKEAVKHLAMLLRCLFTAQQMIVTLEEVQWYTDQAASLAPATEQNLVLHD